MIFPRLPRFAVVAFGLLGAAAAIQSCSSDSTNPSSGAGTVGGTGGSGGTGAGTGGASQLPVYCTELCEHLASIMCPSWDNCTVECPDAPGCPIQYEAKVKCWVENKTDFTCTQTQVVPPLQCKPFEDAFNDCFGGTGGNGTGGDACPGQVCGHEGPDDKPTKCSCKTSCGNAEFASQCALQGTDYTCSCYNHETLLGTCSEMEEPCHNDLGCCAPYFTSM